MGQVLDGSAATIEAVRRAIQHSQESLRGLAKRYGINPTTVAKWRKRSAVSDLPTGPREPRSTVLSPEDEATIVAFRRHTLLPLDDCPYALQATIPALSRSALHRCLQRHGISRLPDTEGDRPARKRFKPYPIGYFHIDIAEIQTVDGKLYLCVGIDRTSNFAFAQLAKAATRVTASAFLDALVAAAPYRIHTVFTDNGIEHRFTKINHPWTNGQVERINQTIKDATVRRFHYDSHSQLQQHLDQFIDAYNFARRQKTLKGLTPYEFICKAWADQPERFTFNPHHQMPGSNTWYDIACRGLHRNHPSCIEIHCCHERTQRRALHRRSRSRVIHFQ